MVSVSVIIPTLNEEKYLEKTLSALKPQLEKGDEIIVVDSYSNDHTVRIAKKFGAKIVYIQRCGIGPAKTFGAKKAKNDIIAMLDADGVPFPDWLSKIKKHFESNNISAVAGFGLYEGSTNSRNFLYNFFSRMTFKIGRLNYLIEKSPWMPVNNCAIRKKPFFRYGGLRKVVCEDFDFAQRAKGLKVIYDWSINVALSDRRFEKEGFKKTIFLWMRSNFAILTNKNKISATRYNVVR